MSDGVVGVRGHVKLTGLRLNSVDVSNSDDAQEAVTNLNNSAENLQAAESRIRDLDMAEEIMAFTKNNILQQAATAMLAQANMAPQSVLQLLG
jgi:flagellin-like hook-associated protein FlgL